MPGFVGSLLPRSIFTDLLGLFQTMTAAFSSSEKDPSKFLKYCHWRPKYKLYTGLKTCLFGSVGSGGPKRGTRCHTCAQAWLTTFSAASAKFFKSPPHLSQ